MKEIYNQFKTQETAQKVETLEQGYRELLMSIQATTRSFEELKSKMDVSQIRTNIEEQMKRNMAIFIEELFKNEKHDFFNEMVNKIDGFYKKDLTEINIALKNHKSSFTEIHDVLLSHKEGLAKLRNHQKAFMDLLATFLCIMERKGFITRKEILNAQREYAKGMKGEQKNGERRI